MSSWVLDVVYDHNLVSHNLVSNMTDLNFFRIRVRMLILDDILNLVFLIVILLTLAFGAVAFT